MVLLINDLLDHSKTEREKEILLRLKELNLEANQVMMGGYRTFKPKYHQLQTTSIWTEAKGLILEYLLLTQKGPIICKVCKKEVDPLNCTLHHGDIYKESYKLNELFSPSSELLLIVHHKCHAWIHRKRGEGK